VLSAAGAESNSRRSGRTVQGVTLHNFAQSLVVKQRRFGAILRIRDVVLSAAGNFKRIVTGRQPVVPVFVETESVPPTRTYNLTLAEDNAYYANGILVFNCLTFAQSVAPQAVMASRPAMTGVWS